MIHTLGNTMLNLQQISSQLVVHIILSLPLHSSSRKCVFINTSSQEECTFILKPKSLLQKESDDSKQIMCQSIIDHYVNRPQNLVPICLSNFASNYKIVKGKPIKQHKASVIRFVKYNKHVDYENYYREKILLYVPFQKNENTIKNEFETIQKAYKHYKNTIEQNESKYTYNFNSAWGDLDDAFEQHEQQKKFG